MIVVAPTNITPEWKPEALSTIRAIAKRHVSVQFDHMTELYNVEMVKYKFMIMKNFYVYRE